MWLFKWNPLHTVLACSRGQRKETWAEKKKNNEGWARGESESSLSPVSPSFPPYFFLALSRSRCTPLSKHLELANTLLLRQQVASMYEQFVCISLNRNRPIRNTEIVFFSRTVHHFRLNTSSLKSHETFESGLPKHGPIFLDVFQREHVSRNVPLSGLKLIVNKHCKAESRSRLNWNLKQPLSYYCDWS